MNILVCFKVVPNLDLLSAADFTADESLCVETGFVPTAINCYDESALELARALAEHAEDEITLTALTVGGSIADTAIKTLYALGYAKGVRIEFEGDIRFVPEQVAALVCAYTEHHPQDVILAGVQSPEGDNAQMPLLLAEQLGYPCITQVTDLHFAAPDILEVESVADDGTLIQRVRTPVVLAVGDARSTYLKVPTLKDRMQKGRKPVQVLCMENTPNAYTPAAQLQGLQALSHHRQGQVIAEGSPKEKAALLYERYMKEIGKSL